MVDSETLEPPEDCASDVAAGVDATVAAGADSVVVCVAGCDTTTGAVATACACSGSLVVVVVAITGVVSTTGVDVSGAPKSAMPIFAKNASRYPGHDVEYNGSAAHGSNE